MNLRAINLGIFALCFSLLLFELTLIRVYSATLFYHFAFMAISVAMLGLSAAGLTVHLYPHRFRLEDLHRWGRRWSILYALSIVAALWIEFRLPVNVYLAPDEISGKLALIYILSAIPFYFAGLCIAALFNALPQRIGSLYAWDLAGAGLGAVAIIPLMNWAGGESAGFYLAAVGFITAALFSVGRWKAPALLAVAALVLGMSNPHFGWMKIIYSKGQHVPSVGIRFNEWNSFSRIIAMPFKPGTDAVYTWCPSPNYPLPIMEHYSLIIDDGAATPVLPFDGKNLEPIEYLKYDLTALAHRLNGSGTTLVIGCGGGRDVLTGLLFGADSIDAVDLNPLIFDAMKGPLRAFNGDLYRHPLVDTFISEGRAFTRRHPASYDLVQVAMIDTWAATTAGAYSLSENSLYTIEAFHDYFQALKPGGILSFTRFFFFPPRQALRLVSIYLEAAERYGIDSPERCILVAKYESLATLLFKVEPFTNEEISRFDADLKDLGFDLVYAPDDRPDRFFSQLVEIDDRELYYQRYPFDIRPPVDDKPFFFNMLKFKDFLRASEILEGQRFNYHATQTLIYILVISVIMTLVTLLLPLVWRGGGLGMLSGKYGLLTYFICIGLAYIAVEVALLQRFVLLLEHPAFAASGVVAGLLVSSGLGSMYWGRSAANSRRRLLLVAFSVIIIGLSMHAAIGSSFIHLIIHLPMGLKMIIALLMIAPLGFFMGMPLPAGIGVAGSREKDLVAWCWAVNGAASVLASTLSVTLAMAHGFAVVLAVGLICYMAAGLLMASVVMRPGDMAASVT